MADEILKKDANSRFVAAGVTDDANTDVTQLRVDPTSKGLMSEIVLPSAIVDGRKTVTAAGTAVPLVAAPTACRKVIVTALSSNTDMVVVGASTVVAAVGTRRGTPLQPDNAVEIEISDVSLIYIDSLVSGEGVSFTYLS